MEISCGSSCDINANAKVIENTMNRIFENYRIFLYPEYDPDLLKTLFTSSFCQKLRT